MVLSNLNLLAVVVAGVVYFMLGGVWYTLLFAKVFTRYRVKAGESLEGAAATDYLITLITDVVSAFVVAIVLQAAGAASLLDGIGIGLLVGIGLASTATLKYTIFNGPPKMLWLIDFGLILAGFAAMGTILTLWR